MLRLLLGALIKLRKRRRNQGLEQVAEPQKGQEFMSTIEDVSAEQLAKVFHYFQEALTHDGDCRVVEEVPSSWDRAAENERKLMLAAARLTLLELATSPAEPTAHRKYYANPGEAEWGS